MSRDRERNNDGAWRRILLEVLLICEARSQCCFQMGISESFLADPKGTGSCHPREVIKLRLGFWLGFLPPCPLPSTFQHLSQQLCSPGRAFLLGREEFLPHPWNNAPALLQFPCWGSQGCSSQTVVSRGSQVHPSSPSLNVAPPASQAGAPGGVLGCVPAW